MRDRVDWGGRDRDHLSIQIAHTSANSGSATRQRLRPMKIAVSAHVLARFGDLDRHATNFAISAAVTVAFGDLHR
jgi:hypothetical protein